MTIPLMSLSLSFCDRSWYRTISPVMPDAPSAAALDWRWQARRARRRAGGRRLARLPRPRGELVERRAAALRRRRGVGEAGRAALLLSLVLVRGDQGVEAALVAPLAEEEDGGGGGGGGGSGGGIALVVGVVEPGGDGAEQGGRGVLLSGSQLVGRRRQREAVGGCRFFFFFFFLCSQAGGPSTELGVGEKKVRRGPRERKQAAS